MMSNVLWSWYLFQHDDPNLGFTCIRVSQCQRANYFFDLEIATTENNQASCFRVDKVPWWLHFPFSPNTHVLVYRRLWYRYYSVRGTHGDPCMSVHSVDMHALPCNPWSAWISMYGLRTHIPCDVRILCNQHIPWISIHPMSVHI